MKRRLYNGLSQIATYDRCKTIQQQQQYYDYTALYVIVVIRAQVVPLVEWLPWQPPGNHRELLGTGFDLWSIHSLG